MVVIGESHRYGIGNVNVYSINLRRSGWSLTMITSAPADWIFQPGTGILRPSILRVQRWTPETVVDESKGTMLKIGTGIGSAIV